jgi:hypothetical protein
MAELLAMEATSIRVWRIYLTLTEIFIVFTPFYL